MNVIKRDGRIVDFDISKISNAIAQAMKRTSNFDNELVLSIADKVASKCKDGIKVEEIQDLVQHFLMTSSRKDVAQEYIRYRERRSMIRRQNSKFMGVIKTKLDASDVQNQNANVDESSFGGRKGEAANELVRQFVLDNVLSQKSKFNHINNRIYIHDLCDYTGQHNCLSLPIDQLLKNGFKTRQTDIRPAGSLAVALQLFAVACQCQSLDMFGGVAITHADYTLVPYYRKSFYKHYVDGYTYMVNHGNPPANEPNVPIEELSVESSWYAEDIYPDVYKYATDMTQRELKQSVEGFIHNMNSLQSRAGSQLPFSSANFGTCTLIEGQRIIDAFLDGILAGTGPHHRTSIFPCFIMKLKDGVNKKPGDPNYYLYRKALMCTARRIYPNYCNVDWSVNAGYDPNDPSTQMATMGGCKLQLM